MFSEILHTSLTALASVVSLFVMAKLMGQRQIAQLSMFDYINGITIGSIAAEMATSEFTDVLKPFVAMIVYTFAIVITALITDKSIRFRRFSTGKAVVLFNNGELYKANFKHAKIDICEFLSLCRIAGYFDLSKLQTAVLEPSGDISFLPLSTDRPLNANDINLQPQQEFMVANIIIDGNLMLENLRHTGNDEKWLHSQLKAQGVNDVSEVFLATCDSNNKLSVFKMTDGKMKLNLFD
ncbi:conserved membrane-associated protein [Lachnospiraceae bacterium KM106-2]|nr:conserved membrane-associated protein [Lachnospiraceae bacterium KM106-2]